jgi:hypothetical protein
METLEVEGAKNRLRLAESEMSQAFAEVAQLIDSAVTALALGDTVEASQLLTDACDLEFDLLGDTECVSPLFDALGLSDGKAPRDG